MQYSKTFLVSAIRAIYNLPFCYWNKSERVVYNSKNSFFPMANMVIKIKRWHDV